MKFSMLCFRDNYIKLKQILTVGLNLIGFSDILNMNKGVPERGTPLFFL